jgi:hypothetical protein
LIDRLKHSPVELVCEDFVVFDIVVIVGVTNEDGNDVEDVVREVRGDDIEKGVNVGNEYADVTIS